MGAVYVYNIYSGNKKKRRKLDFEELCLTPPRNISSNRWAGRIITARVRRYGAIGTV
jgi:hypothetical protein